LSRGRHISTRKREIARRGHDARPPSELKEQPARTVGVA
jgi:hypothetical protein